MQEGEGLHTRERQGNAKGTPMPTARKFDLKGGVSRAPPSLLQLKWVITEALGPQGWQFTRLVQCGAPLQGAPRCIAHLLSCVAPDQSTSRHSTRRTPIAVRDTAAEL